LANLLTVLIKGNSFYTHASSKSTALTGA